MASASVRQDFAATRKNDYSLSLSSKNAPKAPAMASAAGLQVKTDDINKLETQSAEEKCSDYVNVEGMRVHPDIAPHVQRMLSGVRWEPVPASAGRDYVLACCCYQLEHLPQAVYELPWGNLDDTKARRRATEWCALQYSMLYRTLHYVRLHIDTGKRKQGKAVVADVGLSPDQIKTFLKAMQPGIKDLLSEMRLLAEFGQIIDSRLATIPREFDEAAREDSSGLARFSANVAARLLCNPVPYSGPGLKQLDVTGDLARQAEGDKVILTVSLVQWLMEDMVAQTKFLSTAIQDNPDIFRA
jgi:hypothetical protein